MELLMMTPHGGEMMEVDMEDEEMWERYCGYTEHSRGDTVCTWCVHWRGKERQSAWGCHVTSINTRHVDGWIEG